MAFGRRAGVLAGVFSVMLLTGCGMGVVPGADATQLPAPTPTFTPIPTLTSTPELPREAIATNTLAVAGTAATVYGVISADNVNLRTKPGTVFPVSRLLAKGTPVQVVARAPGGDWLYVLTDSSVYGWVLQGLVQGGYDGPPLPVMQPQGVQVVQGKVVDRAGVPVSGIGFAITQGTGATALRTDATSDGAGQFYGYLPESAQGQWLVSYVSVACTSNTMDAHCNCIGFCGRPDPASVTITLPSKPVLQFVWK